MRQPVGSAVVVLALAATGVSAQVPAGSEFRVNTYTTATQYLAAVSADVTGGFVVVWSSNGNDGSGLGVFAQRYAASGLALGSELQINTYTTGGQWQPAVAPQPGGDFVVVWAGAGASDVDGGIFARRHAASGAPLGAEFRVNTYTTNAQAGPQLASDAAGGFVVVWWSEFQDGSVEGVFGQRFDASGMPRGSEFQANTFTPGGQRSPSVGVGPDGGFVVAWNETLATIDAEIAARRYDASGVAQGTQFQVNSYTTGSESQASVAVGPAGDFVVAWTSYAPTLFSFQTYGRRFDASGAPLGAEFRIGASTPGNQSRARVVADPSGGFVVAWADYMLDGSDFGIFAQRYDAAGGLRGSEFAVNTYTTGAQRRPSLATDAVGNLVVTWDSGNVFAQRFGGLLPAALAVDAVASSGSDGNGVLEPGETSVATAPSWRNLNGAALAFDGLGLSFSGPPAGGVSYSLADAVGAYGALANGSTAVCSDCYAMSVGYGGARPATHWDATFTERLTPDVLGQTKPWLVHVGESFVDVPRASGYYRFVETLLHEGVTGGCGADTYCPFSSTTREQMAVFVLAAKEGAGYSPPACSPPNIFGDVPEASPFCRFIEELATRGVVGGCGGANYCPTSPVTREQMSIFTLKTLEPALVPPPCSPPNIFNDVPETNPFCAWIEELAKRGVVSGCGGGNYCPTDPVTREQMAVFISVTFALTLYGP